jgi:hypothetical protein
MIFLLYVLLKDEIRNVWRKLLKISDSNIRPHPNVPTSRPKAKGKSLSSDVIMFEYCSNNMT